MTYHFVENPVTHKIQLRISEPMDDSDIEKIGSNDYDLLWLYHGQFPRMAEAVTGKNLNIPHLKLNLTGKQQDVTWLNEIGQLEILTIEGKIKGDINFDELAGLQFISVPFSKTTRAILTMNNPTVKKISLTSLTESLEQFDAQTASQIELLGLTGGSLEDLSGIEQFSNIKTLCLDNMRKLSSIKQICHFSDQLEVLAIYGCNQIDDLSCLSELTALRDITLEIKELPSLDLLPKQNLCAVSLGGSLHILDSDVEKFLTFPKLNNITYSKRKGYKYTAEQLNPLLPANTGKRRKRL